MKRLTFEQRFWSKVARGGPDACWAWLGTKSPRGYGSISYSSGAAMLRAHRVSWMLANGPLRTDLQVLHTCDNPSCVNPAHLRAGTHADNMRDRNAKGRQARGTRVACSKLRPGEVRTIRRWMKRGLLTQRECARLFDVSQTLVGRILRGQVWKELL